MSTIEIYTTPLCPFCWRAKKLLNRKGVEYREIDVWRHPTRREEMRTRADGRHTVPQIFIGDRGIGGCDELYDLERRAELDPLLASARRGSESDQGADASNA